ncbi:hypothetical protein HanRHA438_Chr01g0011111 [Helianthus annuus]|nr:hypothetical protein HanRHA438_Chr01g0011111 [Helianthus annuus]
MGGGRRGRIVGHNRVRVRVRLTVEKLGEVINRYREGERRVQVGEASVSVPLASVVLLLLAYLLADVRLQLRRVTDVISRFDYLYVL